MNTLFSTVPFAHGVLAMDCIMDGTNFHAAGIKVRVVVQLNAAHSLAKKPGASLVSLGWFGLTVTNLNDYFLIARQ
eukprot:5256466-Amphidinium_carterae.1